MSLKQVVDSYLEKNFEQIQSNRLQSGFSWRPVVNEINKNLTDKLDPDKESDRDYVRNRFKNFRKGSAPTQEPVKVEIKLLDTYNVPQVKPKNEEEEFKQWKQEKLKLFMN